MRVATVFFPDKRGDRLSRLAHALARGIEAQGHQVDLINARHDSNMKLSMYQYIAVGAEQTGIIRATVSSHVTEYLRNAGVIGGKKCFAFLLPRHIGSSKALGNLMRVMEREGMFIRFSEVVRTTGEAEAVGKRLQI